MNDQESPAKPDWGNVAFRRPRLRGIAADSDLTGSRFAIGLSVFLVGVLAYPGYSYWVQSRLLARDVESAVQQLEAQSKAASAALRRQLRAQDADEAERARQQRIARVSVRGVSEGSGTTIVIVDLGAASLSEATDAICAQVRRRRGAGTYDWLQVQRFDSSGPGRPLGRIQCRS